MSRAFTRAEVTAMSQEEAAANIDAINGWVAAGAVDGQAPPERKTQFTRAELDAMSPEQAAEHVDAINAQLASGGIA